VRAEAASKIAPDEFHAFFEVDVAVLDVFDVFGHGDRVQRKMEKGKRKMVDRNFVLG
jgi:hypothetical protein